MQSARRWAPLLVRPGARQSLRRPSLHHAAATGRENYRKCIPPATARRGAVAQNAGGTLRRRFGASRGVHSRQVIALFRGKVPDRGHAGAEQVGDQVVHAAVFEQEQDAPVEQQAARIDARVPQRPVNEPAAAAVVPGPEFVEQEGDDHRQGDGDRRRHDQRSGRDSREEIKRALVGRQTDAADDEEFLESSGDAPRLSG